MRYCWAAAAAIFMVLAPLAGAIQEPTVTFIPSQISVNSSFLMIADPHASPSETVDAIQWIVFGTNGYGSFNMVGNKGVCYFSVTDSGRTCGPYVFTYPSYGYPYELQVTATAGSMETALINVSVGGLTITGSTAVEGNKVYIFVQATGGIVQGGISYATYNADTLELVSGKSGTMTIFQPPISGYNTSITLPYGVYYITFTADTGSDFGGGVSRVVVGQVTPGESEIKADDIVYSPVIYPGQLLSIGEMFRITNTGSDNLSGISVSVPQDLSSYISIMPQNTFLGPNESTYMALTLRNIQYSTNITTYATLAATSGSSQKELQIPVDLRVTVIGSSPSSACSGQADMSLCLGGKCCGETCISGADCCRDYDCSGQICLANICTGSPNECTGQADNSSCSGGVCCSESCISGGQCCSDYDCGLGETCTYNNKCEAQQENDCSGKTDLAACSGGVCCSSSCISGAECCSDLDCLSSLNQTCVSYKCETPSGSSSGGFDIMTIAIIGGGVAAAAVVGFLVFKKLRKKGGNKEEEGGEGEEEEFSEEDFY